MYNEIESYHHPKKLLPTIGGALSHTIRVGTSIMRPCNSLVELAENINSDGQEFQFNIVPFNDDVDSLSSMLASLGDKIDCFVSPCGSMDLLMKYNFLPLGTCKCAIAMSKKHPLAKKEIRLTPCIANVFQRNSLYLTTLDIAPLQQQK